MTKKTVSQVKVILRYAIDRLTDNDLSGVPDDMRHEWVRQASRILEVIESEKD